jgi:hypothetical protein
MGIYLYNPNSWPEIFGSRNFLPKTYSVVSSEEAAQIKQAGLAVVLEDSPNFKPLWVEEYHGKSQK